MAVGFPQFDARYGGSGGSDVWDNGLAGELLLADFFDTTPAAPQTLKYWDGGAWVEKPLKRWNGSEWADVTTLKRWNGSVWV